MGEMNMDTLNEINEKISKYALFCKKGLLNNLVIIFNDEPIMKLTVEYELSIAKLKFLNKMFANNKALLPKIRFGIITSSKITSEIIRCGNHIDFFHQAKKDSFPEVISETIISEFKAMKLISDKNNLRERESLMPTLS